MAEKKATRAQKMMHELNKAHGKNTFVGARDVSANVKAYVDTNIPVLNVLLSGSATRGMATGRIYELYGEEHVGKTTIGCGIIARCQREQDGLGCLIDTESTLTHERMQTLGIVDDSLLCCEEVFAESIIEQIETVVEKCGKHKAVIFWDTVAATRSKSLLGSAIGRGRRGALATVMSEGMTILSKLISRSNCVLIACNQLRDGGIDGNPFHTKRELESTKGGRALKYHAAARIKMEYGSDYYRMVKGVKVHYGMVVNVVTFKNKFAPNDVDAKLVFQSKGKGSGNFNSALSCLHTLQRWGVLPRKVDANGRINFNDEKLTIGTWETKYNEDKKFRDKVHEALERHFSETFRGVPYGIEEGT